MSASKKLRLAYVAEWLLAASVSAIPVEHLPEVVEAGSSVVVTYGKREEENPESLKYVVDTAAALHHNVTAHGGHRDGDGYSDGDSVSADSSDGSSATGGFGGKKHDSKTPLGVEPPDQADGLPTRLEGKQGPSTVARDLMIAGGAIAAFILVAAIAFWLYKARGKIFRRANFKYWERGGAHRLRGGDTVYDEKSSPLYPQRISRPGMERKHSIPGMPFPPPPVALAPSDTPLGRHQSRKRLLIRTSLLPKNRPVASPSPIDQKGTFYDGASDMDSPSSQQREQPPLPPPAYMTHNPLRSPAQSSSISNIEPRNTTTNSRQPSYAQMYPPPPIPESNTAPRRLPPMDSHFSWTTTSASGSPSGAKSLRSSVESEPRFRGVNSWVSHQAGRLERSERLTRLQLEQQQARDIPLNSSPGTPGTFAHHPGAPVTFLEDPVRKESADLDRRVLQWGR